MATYRIYALVEPDTETVRYVGQTADHLHQRRADHLRVRGTSARANWLRSLIAQGTRPRIVLLEEVTGTRRNAYAAETQWIRKLRAEGHPLVNVP
jgi:hypothetical protein